MRKKRGMPLKGINDLKIKQSGQGSLEGIKTFSASS